MLFIDTKARVHNHQTSVSMTLLILTWRQQKFDLNKNV